MNTTTPSCLTQEQLEQACRNIGYDLRCGQCASVFYTGAGNYNHSADCETALENRGVKTDRATLTAERDCLLNDLRALVGLIQGAKDIGLVCPSGGDDAPRHAAYTAVSWLLAELQNVKAALAASKSAGTKALDELRDKMQERANANMRKVAAATGLVFDGEYDGDPDVVEDAVKSQNKALASTLKYLEVLKRNLASEQERKLSVAVVAAEKVLVDSIQKVAEAARDLYDNASETSSDEAWLVGDADMQALHGALEGWTKASNDFMAISASAAAMETKP